MAIFNIINFKIYLIMRKFFVLLAGMVLFLASSLTFIYVKGENDSVNDLLSANVDALADDEPGGKLDTNYNRIDSKCEIFVSAGTQINLFGVGVITAKADGTIAIDGKVVCESKGNSTCRPVECSDLYSVILHGGER